MDDTPLRAWLVTVLESKDFRLDPLTGGASDRRYVRVSGPAVQRVVGAGSAVAMGVPAKLRTVVRHFSSTRRFLEEEGLPVPACFAESPDGTLCLPEDLGDTTLADIAEPGGERCRLYDAATQLLARLHAVPRDASRCPAMLLHFDRAKYEFEFSFHVRHWLLAGYLGDVSRPADREELDRTFHWIARTLAAAPRAFTHRDFQSTNLMITPDRTLAIVDFQDARQGTRAYDLASLLYDSYVDLTDKERVRLEAAYRENIHREQRAEERDFHRLVVVAALQRKLHDVGAFIYTAHARGKTEYLRWVPRTLDMIESLARRLGETRRMGEILAELRCSSGKGR